LGAGYTIPAGWAVMVCPPAVHLNPEIYEDPLAFNPWRWQVCALSSLCKLALNLYISIFACELNLRINLHELNKYESVTLRGIFRVLFA
jgi:hypothetical protein